MKLVSEMKNWDSVRIGDIFTVTSGGTPSRDNADYYLNGNIPWIKTGDLKGKYLSNPDEFITNEALNNSSAKLFPKQTVLLAMYGATIGACSILPFEAATNQACAALLPNDQCSEEYLYYFFKSFQHELIKMGVGGAQPNISAGKIKDIQIPLPPLPIQQKIAAILDAADAYRQHTKALIEKYDQLAQSLFLDMFGKNSGKEISFNDLADKRNKGTFSNGPFGSDLLTSELTTSGVPVIYIRDLRNGQYNWKSNVYVTHKKAAELINCQVRLNDVLIAKVGDPPGIAAIYSGEDELAVITQDVIRLRVNTKIVSPKFIQFWFNSQIGQVTLKSIIVEGTRKRFGLGDLKKTKINVPAIALQNLFAERIQLIEAQKQQAQLSLQKSEELFQSLLQKAFNGELVG